MKRKVTQSLMLATLLFAGACSSLAYKTRVEEFTNSNIQAGRFTTIAVLPIDPNGFDPGIAARVRDSLKKQGINIVSARSSMPESEVSMPHLCPKNDPPEYKGVLWVTFDRIILRDCESAAIAYRATGGYAGVDVLARKLATYLKTAPPVTPQN